MTSFPFRRHGTASPPPPRCGHLVPNALALAWASWSLLGCGNDELFSRTPATGGGGGAGASSVGGSPGPGTAAGSGGDEDSSVVFASEAVSTFELEVDPGDLEWLRSHALEETFVPAVCQVDGEAIGQVGLRYKGAYSLDHCFENGAQTCFKVSMKLKFSEYDPALRFHGLRRLAFDAYVWDQSLMRDRLAFDLFRAMDVVAPRSTHANLVINGEPLGLFSLVEQVDGSYTDEHFPGHGDGNLYKEAWPDTNAEAWYSAHLRTNEETGDHSAIIAFAEALGSASDDELPSVLEDWMEVDTLLRYMAVEQASNDWDGITTWYHWDDPIFPGGADEVHNHNFYLYQDEDDARFTLIPWDLDQTFEARDRLPEVPKWYDAPSDCSRRYSIHDGTATAREPACDPLLRGLAVVDRERYLDAIRELLDGPFQLDLMNEKLDRWAAQIADSVAADPIGPSTEAWESGLALLRSDLATLRQRLENFRDGVESVPFELAVVRTNDFEDTDILGFRMGIGAICNDRSAVAATLHTDSPIAGTADARIDFDFRNEPGQAWSHWVLVDMPLAAGTGFDLNAAEVTGIRLTVKGDRARAMRVDVESPECIQFSGGICFGWVIQLDGSVQTVDLPLAEATLPDWATPAGEELVRTMSDVLTLNFRPEPVGRDGSGFLPEDATDTGFVQIDDIEFIRR
ncbi:MAG: CotH kinase family protein [Polyangiaceae bacterium]|nr:CotH kinase family protein [Polyangiaceae bacterium]